MAPGTLCLAMTKIKPFCRQKLCGILSFFGLFQVAAKKNQRGQTVGHRRPHRLMRRNDRRLLLLLLLACMALGVAISLRLDWFSPSKLKEKATETFLMEYLPKDTERGESLKKAKEATEGMD